MALRERRNGAPDLVGGADRVDALLEAADVVCRQRVTKAALAKTALARLPLTELGPLASGDADQPGLGAPPARVEAGRNVDGSQESLGDEVDDVGWLRATAHGVAKDGLAVATVEFVEILGTRLERCDELGVSTFDHIKHFHEGCYALQPHGAGLHAGVLPGLAACTSRR